MVNFRINVIINPIPAVAGLKKVDVAMTRTSVKAGLLGAALLRALAPIASGIFIISGIKILAKFGQAMSTVAAITGATGEEFDELREKAILLGRDTRFSASEAADGMTFLARAGFDANEVLSAIGPTLDLAVAGNLDLARAADIASNVLKGFRLPVSEMTRVLDVMALAANSSNTNVAQLGDALKFVAPVAAGLGLSLEETTAAIGSLSDAGLQASLAGTGLRKVLGELESPSDKTKKIFKELGINFEDTAVSADGLIVALGLLKQSGVDVGDALEVFGQRGGPAFEVMVNAVPAITELRDELKLAAGAGERMADIMDDNLFGALRRVKSAFETLVIRLGDAGAEGALRRIFESLAQGLRNLANNIDAFVNAIEGIVFVVAVKQIKLLTLWMGRLSLAILANPIGAFATAVVVTTGFLIAFRDEITLTAESTTTLADTAAAAFDKIKSIMDSFVPLIKEIGGSINDVFGGAFDGFELNLQNILLALATFSDTAIGAFLALGNSLKALFTGLPEVVASGFIVVLNAFIGFMENIVDRVRATVLAIGDTVSRMGTLTLNFFSELNQAANQLAVGNAAAASRITQEATDLLAKNLGGIGKIFKENFKRNLEELGKDDLLGQLENPFEGAGEDLAAAMIEGFEKGISFSGFTDFILETFTAADAAAAQREALEAQAAAQAKANEETAKAIELQGGLAPATDKATKSIGSMSESLSGGFRAGLESGLAGVTDVSGAMETTMVNAFSAAEDALVSFVTTGEADFSALVDGILEDLTRLLARQALLALINAFSGGAAGGGGAAGIASLLAEKAEGGPVRAGEPTFVGERGRELFIPPGAGSIATAAATAQAVGSGAATAVQAPPVNITVVNVTDPKDVVSAINTPEGEQMILNIISKNRSTVRDRLA